MLGNTVATSNKVGPLDMRNEHDSIVHSSASIESPNYRCNLSEEPCESIFVGYEYKSVMILAQFVGETDTVVFNGNTQNIGEK